MTCGKCRFLRVLPDADGKIRVRKTKSYLCTVPIPLRLPKSVRNYQQPRPTFMEPDEGDGCVYFAERVQ